MQVIDVDPELLRRSAEAALHAAEQASTHIQSEFKDEVAGIMETLVPTGPYGYTRIWRLQVQADGSFKLPIAKTRAEILEGYGEVHEMVATLSWESLIEIRGEWYTFVEGTGTGLDKTTGTHLDGDGTSIILIPSGTGKGITGELVWIGMPPEGLGLGAKRDSSITPLGAALGTSTTPSTNGNGNELAQRREMLRQHDSYLSALQAADVEGLLECLSVDAQAAIRDYVNDTGTLVVLDGIDAQRSFYRSLFERFQVRSVDLIHRVVQGWYMFAEVRLTVVNKGKVSAFHTAEFFVPGHDGRFLVRIGHGTDIAVMNG